MIKEIIIMILILFFTFKLIIYPMFFEKHSNTIDLYFGIPGSGKTTLAALFSKKYQKKGIKVYSNVNIKGNYILSPIIDLGTYEIKDSLVIIDEAGLEFDNRNFKSYPKNCNFFFKYHRHYNCDIIVLSQDLDVDIKIRKLADHYYLLKKSFIPFFIKRQTIKKKIDINDKGEIVDFHYFQFLGNKLFFAPKVWKMFNTIDRPKLTIKDFEKWEIIHYEEEVKNEE